LGIIKLNDIRVYAYHGCLIEEGQIGSDYIVDLEVKADLSVAAHSDALSDTVDYVQLLEIVRNEMAIRSKLLEHVGQRIVDSTLEKLAKVREVNVAIAKINPPIGGDVREVRVIMSGKR